jgi:hypothetical protein
VSIQVTILCVCMNSPGRSGVGDYFFPTFWFSEIQ